MTEDQKISVVISLDSSNANPQNALQSVLGSAVHVRDVHFVLNGQGDQKAVLAHPRVADAILKIGADRVFWHEDTLDLSRVQTQALVHLQPDHCVIGPAFLALKKDFARYPGCSHFALLSGLDLAAHSNRPTLDWLWYGFLIPLLFVDTLASWVTLGQHARTVDLRATLIFRAWPNRNRLPGRPAWWRWWFGTRTGWTRGGTGQCVQAPLAQDLGTSFVWRTIHQHAHCHAFFWRMWWNTLFCAHYAFNVFFINSLLYPVFGLDWRIMVPLYFLQMGMICYAIWSRALHFPWYTELIAVLLYPGYLLLFPSALMYGRYYNPNTALKAAFASPPSPPEDHGSE